MENPSPEPRLDAGSEEELARLRAENARLKAELAAASSQRRASDGSAGDHQQLNDAFMQAPLPMAILEGPEHRFLIANPPYEKFIGKKAVGRTLREVFNREEVAELIPRMDAVYQTGRPYSLKEAPFTLVDENGERRRSWLNIGYHPFRDAEGEIKGIIAIVLDVTEQVEARERTEAATRELAIEKQKLEVLVKESPAAIGLLRGSEYVFEIANAKWRELVSEREYLGRRYADIYPELIDSPAFQSIKDTFATGKTYTAHEMKLLVRSRAGELEDQYFDYTNILVRDGEGKPYGVFCHAMNVTSSVLSRMKLERAQAQVVDILESMTDAFFSIDKDWIITRVNSLHEKATQKRREEQLGKNFLDLYLFMPEAPETNYWINYHKAMKERIPVYFEDYYPPLDLWTGVNVYPQADGGLAVFYRYITEQKRAQAALQKTIEARDTFLGIASHELKTPLTSLKLQAQLHQRLFEKRGAAAFDADRIKKIIENPIVQAERLARLVDDMLDVSRIASGKLSMNVAETDLAILVSETLSRFAPQLEAAKCQLSADLDPGTIAEVDSFRFEQVVTNLITNVAKYAPGQPVEVTLKKTPNTAILRIRDHGGGIPADQHDRVFERFERLVSASKVSGLGLGLHISKEIVEAHGGTIQVESAVGRGAEFTVILPLRAAKQAGG